PDRRGGDAAVVVLVPGAPAAAFVVADEHREALAISIVIALARHGLAARRELRLERCPLTDHRYPLFRGGLTVSIRISSNGHQMKGRGGSVERSRRTRSRIWTPKPSPPTRKPRRPSGGSSCTSTSVTMAAPGPWWVPSTRRLTAASGPSKTAST